PFQGSQLAKAAEPFVAAIESFEKAVMAVAGASVEGVLARLNGFIPLRNLILNIGQLRCDSEEVQECRRAGSLRIGGEHFAVAGSNPCFFSFERKGLGKISLPPHLG